MRRLQVGSRRDVLAADIGKDAAGTLPDDPHAKRVSVVARAAFQDILKMRCRKLLCVKEALMRVYASRTAVDHWNRRRAQSPCVFIRRREGVTGDERQCDIEIGRESWRERVCQYV